MDLIPSRLWGFIDAEFQGPFDASGVSLQTPDQFSGAINKRDQLIYLSSDIVNLNWVDRTYGYRNILVLLFS